MKPQLHPAFGLQLRAVRQAVARQLFRLFPTASREDTNDAISAATETLLRCAPPHVSESTEAIYCYLLTTATRNLLHERRRAKRLISFNNNDEQSLVLAAIPADDSSDTVAAETVLRETIEQRVGKLNAAIVCMRVFDHHSMQHIADAVNVTVKAAYNRYERSLPKLLDIVADSPPPPQKMKKTGIYRSSIKILQPHGEFRLGCGSYAIGWHISKPNLSNEQARRIALWDVDVTIPSTLGTTGRIRCRLTFWTLSLWRGLAEPSEHF